MNRLMPLFILRAEGAAAGEPMQKAQSRFQPILAEAQAFKEALVTPEEVELGRMLYSIRGSPKAG